MERVIDHGGKTKTVIQDVMYHDKLGIDLRTNYEDEEGAWHPTKKGIRLPIEDLDQLIAHLQAIRDAQRQLVPTPA